MVTSSSSRDWYLRQSETPQERVDNSNSAEKILNEEISKLAKQDVESQVFTDFDEQFQALAWLVLILLVIELLILERKNPLFKNVRLFKE